MTYEALTHLSSLEAAAIKLWSRMTMRERDAYIIATSGELTNPVPKPKPVAPPPKIKPPKIKPPKPAATKPSSAPKPKPIKPVATPKPKPVAPPKPQKLSVSVYPNGQGSSVYGNDGTDKHPVQHPISKSVGNEPFKTQTSLKSGEGKYFNGMVNHIKNGGKLPPVVGIKHPEDPSTSLVLDGNHRVAAHKAAGKGKVPTTHIPHENVNLISDSYDEANDEKQQPGTPLSKFRENDGSYDMHKPRAELNNKTLNHYFTHPDGSHDFKSPSGNAND